MVYGQVFLQLHTILLTVLKEAYPTWNYLGLRTKRLAICFVTNFLAQSISTSLKSDVKDLLYHTVIQIKSQQLV